MFDPTQFTSYLFFLFLFAIAGMGWFGLCGKYNWVTFGRDMFGAGIFYFFIAIIFVISYATVRIEDVFEPNGDLKIELIKDNFTLGLFVVLKEVGTAVGIALGFLSLAWSRFFEKSTIAIVQPDQIRQATG